MKKSFSFFKIGLLAMFLPVVVFAQTIGSILGVISGIVGTVMPILIIVAVIYLIVNVIMYVLAGDEEKKAEGRSHMIYGIIGLFVIVAVWGLVNVLISTFGITNNTFTPPSICPAPQVWNPNAIPPQCQ